MKKGKFIVTEGGEGAGKGTQIELLKDWFENMGVLDQFVFTREPGGTEMGEKIREILLSHSSKNISPKTELLLFSSARAQIIDEIIGPALDNGKKVVCDRFFLSTYAYQIYGRELFDYKDFLDNLTKEVVGGYFPDLFIYFDIDPVVGLERTKKRKENKEKDSDRFDEEKIDFHRKVRNGYLTEIKKYPHKIINADQSINSIHEKVREAFRENFPSLNI